MSPIIVKDNNLEESSYKKIFEKYSYLNYEAHANPSNFKLSLENFPENKKVEE